MNSHCFCHTIYHLTIRTNETGKSPGVALPGTESETTHLNLNINSNNINDPDKLMWRVSFCKSIYYASDR